ncbi:aspartic proteinase PCS1-like [Salvia splendens]|uniref:aspartic proteinase PCS1-like n=1 Tax=Salvia splendens TaxID=180675 RepID=UPI001C273B6D|nr:aspartic proteinase PCS1-like [Salvia splendens]
MNLLTISTQIILAIIFFMHSTQSLASQSLILPLKAKLIPSNKLSFHHNISLTVSLTVGSPPQAATMVLDTGSELSWLRCQKTPAAAAPSFSPSLSSSYRPTPCSSSTCTTRTRDFPIPASCDAKHLCHVAVSYADASSVEGNLAAEVFYLDQSNSFDNITFGCMDSGSSSNPEDLKTTGLVGLNRGGLSFITQAGFRKFSYCISGKDSSGVLLFGDADFPWLSPLNYTPLVEMPAATRLPYFDRAAYTVRLEGVRVGNRLLPVQKTIYEPDHTGAGQTMVDSGTQFTFLLGPVYDALKAEFLRQTKGILRPLDEPEFVFQGAMDACFRVELSRRAAPAMLPAVALMFRGVEMSVRGEKLLYRVAGMTRGNDGVYCLTFGNSDLLGVEAYIVGHHHQQNMWMEFDLSKSRVGLADFSCDWPRKSWGCNLRADAGFFFRVIFFNRRCIVISDFSRDSKILLDKCSFSMKDTSTVVLSGTNNRFGFDSILVLGKGLPIWIDA